MHQDNGRFDQDPRLLYTIEESQDTSCPCLSGVVKGHPCHEHMKQKNHVSFVTFQGGESGVNCSAGTMMEICPAARTTWRSVPSELE